MAVDLSKYDLTKLSKKEKLELLDLIEAKKEKAKESRDVFEPHDKQKKLLLGEEPEKYYIAGNGSGKSCVLANWVIMQARGIDPWRDRKRPTPNKTIVVLDNPSKVQDQFLPELQKWVNLKPEWLRKDGKPYYCRINWPNGSVTKLMFHEQNEMVFESEEMDNIAADEPLPRKIYVALKRGQRKKHSEPEMLVVGTPIAQPWVRKEIIEPWSKGELPHVGVYTGSTDDNKENLNWEAVERYFSGLTEKERETRRHGIFFDLEGLALAHLFKEDKHLVEPFEWPNNWPVAIAIDNHPSKNHVAVALGSDGKGQLYAIDELTSKSPPREFAKEIRKMMKDKLIVDIVCDSLGATPMSGGEGNKSFIDILNEEGVRARSTTFKDKNDEAFINSIQSVLEIPREPDNLGRIEPKLKIFTTLKGLISDIRNVQWLKHKSIDQNKPKLDIADKDFLASLKYALTCNLGVRTTRPKPRKYYKKPSPWSGKRKTR